MSVGFDHINIPEVKNRGILVGNTPGVLTSATAELTLALTLATTRRLFEANQEIFKQDKQLSSVFLVLINLSLTLVVAGQKQAGALCGCVEMDLFKLLLVL